VRPFRFRLDRLLALREKIEEERRAAFAKAQDAVRRALGELERTRAARELSARDLEDVDAPGAEGRRHDLIVYTEFLDARLRMLRDDVAARRKEEEEARAALLAAARDRKVLGRLRERRRIEHRRAVGRAEQRESDDWAHRAGKAPSESVPTSFTNRRKPLDDPSPEEA
jgi:flagellar FliJ protein